MAVELDVVTKVDTKSVGEANQAVDGLTASLDKMTGGAITAFNGIVKGAKSGVAAMTTLKGAIAATGVGLLVVAVGTLVSYFKNTQKGADELDRAFAVIGATVNVLIDRISKFGGAIVKLFSGDFKGATEDLTGTFSGLTQEIVKETAAANELEKANQALRDSQIELNIETARQRAEIKRLNKDAEDTTKSDEERVQAAKDAIRIEQELLDKRIKNADENLRIIKAQNDDSNSLTKDREKEAQAEIELLNLKTESLELQTTLTNKLNILETQLAATRKAERDEAELARRKSMEMDEIDALGASGLGAAGDLKVSQNEMLNKKLAEQNKNFLSQQTDMQIWFAEKDLETSEMVADSKMALTNSILSATQSLLEKGSAEAKAVAIAQAIFNAYGAINKTLNSPTLIAPANAIYAAAIGVNAFANVASIIRTPTKMSGGGSSGGGQNTLNVGAAGQGQQGTLPNIGFTDQSQLGDNQEAFRPARAYVIQQDIKNQSSLAQTIEDRQRI